jgi:hypothetical protein
MQLKDTKSPLSWRCPCLLLHSRNFLLLPPGTKASESDNDYRKEQQYKSNAQTPNGLPKVRPASGPIMIDMVAQDSEQAKVSGYHDQAQDPGHECS